MDSLNLPQAWELVDLPFHRLISLGRRVERKEGQPSLRIALLGDAATQHYGQALAATLKLRGWWPEIYEAEFDTIRQEILNPTSELYRFDPEVVILLTAYSSVEMAVEAMKKGAFGFIQKPFRDQDLLDRVNHALRRDSQEREDIEKREDSAKCWETLTPRERDVCHLVVGGLSNKEVGEQLGLSERTVEIHRGRVMTKMGVRAVAQLVHKYALLPTSEWQANEAPATDGSDELT